MKTKLKTGKSVIYKQRYILRASWLVETNSLNYSINKNSCYILIIPGFGIISTVISASSNKNVFGQDGPIIKLKAVCTASSANFKFDDFYLKYTSIYGNSKNVPSFEFLSWLIGFSEGDGSFIIAKRGNLSFVVVQDTRDVQVLYLIQKTLGFGKVVKQSRTTSRFVVQDKTGLYLLCALFNGNIVSKSKLESFQIFLLMFNEYSNIGNFKFEGLKLKSQLVNPNFND